MAYLPYYLQYRGTRHFSGVGRVGRDTDLEKEERGRLKFDLKRRLSRLARQPFFNA